MFFKTDTNRKIQTISAWAFLVPSVFLVFFLRAEAKVDNNNANSNTNVNANSNSNNNSNLNSNVNLNSNSNSNSTLSPEALKQRQIDLQQKEAQLQKVKSQISTYEKKSDILDQKTFTIESILSLMGGEIVELESSIEKTQLSINEIQEKVNNKEHEIVLKEDEIDKRKNFLSEYVRQLSFLDKKSTLEVLLEKSRLSEYFQEIENIVLFEERLRGMLQDLHKSKEELDVQKEDLDQTKSESMSLYAMQEEQRITLENDKRDREELLAETKQEQGNVQGAISQGNEVASRLSSEITALQSLGTKIDFSDALVEAKAVSGLTGVRSAFLLGVLKVESNMGSNVGGGRYETDMNPAQWDRFKNICQELGYDPKDKPVSRKPCYRNASGNCSGWGGAMGPAQFMPSTWMGYRDQVSALTGHTPADPWNLRDALTAMGIKLSKVGGVTDHDRTAEKKAASMYLAGGNWEKFSWYGDRVMKFADTYEPNTK